MSDQPKKSACEQFAEASDVYIKSMVPLVGYIAEELRTDQNSIPRVRKALAEMGAVIKGLDESLEGMLTVRNEMDRLRGKPGFEDVKKHYVPKPEECSV